MITALLSIVQAGTLFAGVPIVLEKNQMDGNLIGTSIEVFEDRNRNLVINDIISPEYSTQFKHSASDAPSYGYSASAYWARFSVMNGTGAAVEWYLEFANQITNRIDIYSRKGTQVKKIVTTGNLFSSERDIRHVTPCIRMTDEPGMTEYYLRVQTNTRVVLPVRIWSSERIHEQIKIRAAVMAVFYGIIAIMLIYNLVIFFFSRERAYLLYVLNSLIILLFSLLNDGYLFIYVIPFNFYVINLTMSMVLFICCTSFGFTRAFLDTRLHAPFMDRFLLRPSMILLGIMAVVFLPLYLSIRIWLPAFNAPFITAINLIALLCILEMIIIGILYLVRRIRSGYFYGIGYFAFLVGGLLAFLREYNIIPITFFSDYLYHVGVIVMLVFFSLGLADYINTMRRRVMALNDGLSEKNLELMRANEELQAVNEEMEAQTETLTKAYEEMEILARALDQADEEIIITDGRGSVDYVNPAFERISGLSRESVLGKDIRQVLENDGEEDICRRALESAMGGTPWSGRINNRRPGRGRCYEDATMRPLKDLSGAITSLVIMKRDVTEQIQLQDQLFQAQKMDAIGTLVSGLAHDFNNILGGITGSMSMIEIEIARAGIEPGHDISQYLDIIKASTERAAEIIRRMLTLSRKNEPDRKPMDINDALKNVLHLCRNSLPKIVKIDFRFSEKPLIVKADPVQLEQMILNLCINASHAMTIMKPGEAQGGELRVAASAAVPGEIAAGLRPGTPDNTFYAMIEVSDEGIGINEENLAKMYEPFYSTKTREGGTGLGLTIVHRIVSQHDGFIDVKSTPGKGTMFRIFLPLSSAPPLEHGISTGSAFPEKGGGRILVIDDESSICHVASSILKEGGYYPVSTTSAVEGVELFQKDPGGFRMVIVDMSMPELSGMEVSRRLLGINPGVRVLIISGFPNDDRIEKTLLMGAAGFLEKPFTAEKLLGKVFSLLRD